MNLLRRYRLGLRRAKESYRTEQALRASDLATEQGEFHAGAFITGEGDPEDADFTGGFFGYPGVTIGGTEYFLLGMELGEMQVGLSLVNGKVYYGGGAGVMDVDGIRGAYGGAITYWLQSDGDVFIGSNVGAPATTSFVVFSNAQTYNGESMGAGDVLLGCNTAGYANVLWDVSDKQLKFRGGVTTRLYIGTDGSLYWSAGWLNNDGMSILYSDTPGDANKIKFTGLLSDAYIYADGAGTICLVSGDGGRGGQHINIAGGDLRIASSANSSFFQMGTGVYIYAGSAMDGQETVFNENGRDINFRIEGDTDANLLRLDAGLDAIGIGGAPTAGQKLKVTGAMTVTGALTPASIAGWAIGTNVQAWDAQLDQLALCAVAANGDFIVGNYGDGSSPTWEKKTAAQARTALGLVIGTNVQAWDTDLDWVAANITTAGKNLIDDTGVAAQRSTLGLGALATKNAAATQADATGALDDVVSKFNALIDKLQAAEIMV
jgi:hypothetical protein